MTGPPEETASKRFQDGERTNIYRKGTSMDTDTLSTPRPNWPVEGDPRPHQEASYGCVMRLAESSVALGHAFARVALDALLTVRVVAASPTAMVLLAFLIGRYVK